MEREIISPPPPPPICARAGEESNFLPFLVIGDQPSPLSFPPPDRQGHFLIVKRETPFSVRRPSVLLATKNIYARPSYPDLRFPSSSFVFSVSFCSSSGNRSPQLIEEEDARAEGSHGHRIILLLSRHCFLIPCPYKKGPALFHAMSVKNMTPDEILRLL